MYTFIHLSVKLGLKIVTYLKYYKSVGTRVLKIIIIVNTSFNTIHLHRLNCQLSTENHP